MFCLPCGRSSIAVPICLRFFIARDGRGRLKVPRIHRGAWFTKCACSQELSAILLPFHYPITRFFICPLLALNFKSLLIAVSSLALIATSVQASSAGTAPLKSAPPGPAVV